jgi:hypothetical protein
MHSIYPLPFEWWVILLTALVLTGAAIWAYARDLQPYTLGLVALPIAPLTAFGWFEKQPLWTAVIVVILTAALYVIGMLAPSEKDDPWHFGALAVALLGKLLIWALAFVGEFLASDVNSPVWLWLISGAIFFAVVVTVVGSVVKAFRRFVPRRRSATPAA